MAYDKQTWNTTSYVNPTRMNHIEDGIEAADSKTADDIPYDSNNSVKDKIDEKVGDWTLYEATTTGYINLPSDCTEFMVEAQTTSGVYSIVIPKKAFDRHDNLTAFYLQGWTYNPTTYAYCFAVKRSATTLEAKIYINGQEGSFIERLVWYR